MRFTFDNALVRGVVKQVDEKAHQDSPLGLPYLVSVIQAEPASGYQPGRDYTIRAACLIPETDVSGRPARPAKPVAPVAAAAPSAPRFLVGYIREGGQFPVQGVILVQATGLTEANGIATRALEAELAADIAEGREQEGAMVMLVNAAEVAAQPTDGVLGQVSW